jgi:chromate transport protein ChrA
MFDGGSILLGVVVGIAVLATARYLGLQTETSLRERLLNVVLALAAVVGLASPIPALGAIVLALLICLSYVQWSRRRAATRVVRGGRT